MVARRILQKLGYTVEVANNGQEAVAKALTGNFDVVFMDLHMPLLDGIEATVKIRKAQATVGTRTPIVALTAAAMAEDRKRAFDAGMDGYVTKPFKMEDLQQVMEPLLRKN
jgi:CheY-like chemotaxis protein